jgi:hypothetical protein
MMVIREKKFYHKSRFFATHFASMMKSGMIHFLKEKKAHGTHGRHGSFWAFFD